ncbi:hypothetical protein BJV74DRAFT_870552 [Russula compacta]|nr:hypothetical protein BJV74DRAFT_870552 [Russula compacta]
MSVEMIEPSAKDFQKTSPLRTASSNTVPPLVTTRTASATRSTASLDSEFKYGAGITLGEALPLDQAARIVNAKPVNDVRVPEVCLVFSHARCRYIVMQHGAGDTVASRQPSAGKYAEGDLAAVAAPLSSPEASACLRIPPPATSVADRSAMTFSLNANRPANTPRSYISRPRSTRYAFTSLLHLALTLPPPRW